MPYLTILLTALVGLNIWIAIEVRSENESLQDALVQNCERSGNPLREGVVNVLLGQVHSKEHEIQKSRETDITKFFPSVPEEELLEAIENKNLEIEKEIDNSRELISTIKPQDCSEVYIK